MVPESLTWRSPDEREAGRPADVKVRESGPVTTRFASRIPGDTSRFRSETDRDAYDQAHQTKGAPMDKPIIRNRRGVTSKQRALLEVVRAAPGHDRAFYAEKMGILPSGVTSMMKYLVGGGVVYRDNSDGTHSTRFYPIGFGDVEPAAVPAAPAAANGHAPVYELSDDPAAYISPDAATLILVELSELEDRRDSLKVALAALRKADA